MIETTLMLRSELANYANTDAKIKRMVDAELLFPIVRGLYETDKTVQGPYLAQSIYGPSYLSFEFALSYHGLIPEAVYNYTCATFESNRKKKFDNFFGVYIYNCVPSKAYPWDILLKMEGEYSYQIATAEKAICDMLYKTSPLKNLNGLKAYLVEDLRTIAY